MAIQACPSHNVNSGNMPRDMLRNLCVPVDHVISRYNILSLYIRAVNKDKDLMKICILSLSVPL